MDDHHHQHAGAHHQDHAGASHHLTFESPEMVAFAELEGEVLGDMVTEAASALQERCSLNGVDVRRLLDIGCGPGVGTATLAQRFGSASVVAVDGSATMLEHAAARADRLGLAQRVETRQVELPAELGALGRAEAAFASMVLHHVGDEVAALGQIRMLLEPDGLLAVIEHAGPVRVLPVDVDLGRPGIWDRLDAAWAAWFVAMRAELPGATPSSDLPTMFDDAGFEVLEDRVLTVDRAAPLDERSRRLAHRQVLQARSMLATHGDAEDLAALEMLLDDSAAGILRRPDALLHATRRLIIARPKNDR